jgi:hypothetical protein
VIDLKAAALKYAKAGLAVMPCNGKVPLLPGHGYKDATTDVDTIARWWDEHPAANIGIVPGSAGMLVVDIDVKGAVDGHDSLDILEAEHGKLPGTRTAHTPSGGVHFYFRVPSGETFGNRRLGVGGIDIRSSAGYVVCPPSCICGKYYRWSNDLKSAPLPDAWVELLRDKPYVPPAPTERPRHSSSGNLRRFLEVAYTEEGNELASAHEGDRNNALNRYGFSLGQLVHLGLKVEDIETQAEWALSQWSWSHGRRDARKDRATLDRAIKDGMQSPRKVAGHE